MLRTVKKRIAGWWAALALLSVELIVTLTVFFIAMLGFAWMVRRVFLLHKTAFDERAFEALGGYVNPFNNEFMVFITFFGTHYFLIPLNIGLVAWFLFVRRHKWYSIKVPTIAISSVLLMLLLKGFFGRPRPLIPLLNEAKGFSFPSGHALMSTTVYGLIIYLVWQNVKRPALRWLLVSLLAIFILCICLSRIYLRVHYTSDVLAGISLGIAWLVLSLTVIRRMEQFSKRTVDPIVESPEVGLIPDTGGQPVAE
jgi:membrane-associated phospholipid phosphatase